MPSRVINVASVAGLSTGDPTSGDAGGLAAPGSGTYSYGPSKAACIHLSKMQASKLAPLNVMVNCICPGLFPSRMTSYGIDRFSDALLIGQPTGRMGQPGDFGGLCCFCRVRQRRILLGMRLLLMVGAWLVGLGGRGPRRRRSRCGSGTVRLERSEQDIIWCIYRTSPG